MILFLAAGLFTACNNNKGKSASNNSTNREQDDYNTRDNTDSKKPDDNTSTTNGNSTNNDRPADNTSSGKWPASEVAAFITNCVSSAQGGKMDGALAQRYCDCMQLKIEQLYPDIRDAAKLTSEDMQSPSMLRLVEDCLK